MSANISLDEENRVVLYSRNLKSGMVFYARFRLEKTELAGNQYYLRESMKTSDQTLASTRATQRYAELKILQNNDMVIRSHTVEDGITKFLEEYKSRLNEGWETYSKDMYRIYRKHVENYWVDYIGTKNLHLVTKKDFEEYEPWRMINYIKTKPSRRTLQLEVNCMKKVMEWSRDEKLYSGSPINFSISLRGHKNRRSAFSIQQYRRITVFLRSKRWLEVGKHKDRGKFDSKIVRHRTMLKEYFMFGCNIGMRIGEMRIMRWRDVTFERTKEGKRYLRVRVSTKTKTGKWKRRTAIGRASAYNALVRLRESREDNLKESDYVFCKPDGTPVSHFREGFDTLLRLASEYIPKDGTPIDCQYDTDYEKYTPYCMRHTYITYQLRYRNRPDIYAIAGNCGTAVQMIELYYSDATPEDFVERLI
jgi:integrase